MKLSTGSFKSDIDRWSKSYKRDLQYRTNKINTIETYQYVLKRLSEFAKKQKRVKHIKDCDREFFLDFIEWSEELSKIEEYAKKTKGLFVAVLKSFFLYISDNSDEYIDYSQQFKKIIPKAIKKGKKIKYLNDDEVNKILDYLNSADNGKGHYRHIYSLAVKLMLLGGLRISEVLSLKMSNITICPIPNENGELDMYEITLNETKSNEEQTAYVMIEAVRNEIDYFSSFLDANEYIFKAKSAVKAPMKRENFYIGMKKKFQKAGVNKSGLHIFRHTCAMQTYRNTTDVLVTQKKLRHSDIATTTIYANAEKIDVIKATRKSVI